MTQGPRIYNVFPLLAGSVTQWGKELPRVARMGFNWVFLNPFHETGGSRSLYAVRDYFRLDRRLRGNSRKPDEDLLRAFVREAERHGLKVMMDLVINHTSRESPLVETHPGWYARDADGGVRSPGAVDPDDASKVTVWGDLAEIDYRARPERDEIVSYWQTVIRHHVGLGIRGFRCDAAYKVPGEVWSQLIATARADCPDALFAAETLGCRLDEVEQLRPAGFDYLFNSSKWWDFRADWLLDQYEAFRHIAPSIAFPESHDTERLAAELSADGMTDAAEIEACYRQRYLFAALFSTGVMMPMGFEHGYRRRLDVVATRPADRETPLFDLSGFIADVNRLKSEIPALNEEGPQRRLPADGVVALLRRTEAGGDWVLTLLNPEPRQAREVALDRLAANDIALEDAEEVTPDGNPPAASGPARAGLAPAGIRVFRGAERRARVSPAPARAPHPAGRLVASVRSQPIVIQNVYPELDCGRFAVKREVGDVLEAWADIFREGHDRIAAILKYRRTDSPEWRESPMTLVEPGLDRWRGRVRLEENARYVYTIEAWPDAFESWRQDFEKKREAGQEIGLELSEGRHIVAAAVVRAERADAERLERVVAEFDAAADEDERAAILTSALLRRLMARCPDRRQAVVYDRELELVVDRARARFGAWYEMFPRSQGTEPGRSATFADCERRLPEIAAMGFDVVYLVPIHPIGRTHRKGPGNTLEAGPDDPGSPYAIGAEEGGHTAVHPELGTLEDFRRFVRAAESHGMEIALDFAIQCSPDHPWIGEHREWFLFRPDGSIKYAENPPKKYQDIVNVNFHGPHGDDLWRALRDVVLFWIGQGVKIFRVDNPHTKPVPFWEWLIRDVQAAHPEVIFLSEAFTRPRMLEMLAKVGFTQSYTYFTWRNFKGELTDYLVELTQTQVKEYLRPNFFTNTPDILPPFLQTGGRPAFRIRLVLAATLSSTYGIYNGFELCENAAVPGKEEYLNSEKYEYKVWDWDRPGNIKDDIARINRIRRENPALHELDNLRFYPASDDHVLFYGKMTPARDNMVFVAVNLDPFDAREVEIDFPLQEMGIPADEIFEVEELVAGDRHLWRGARQRLRLDPQASPAAIFRVTPWLHVDYREPCF